MKWNCWMKQQSYRNIQGHLWPSKLAVYVHCLGKEPNSAQQVCYVGIQEENYLECFKSYDIYK